jgi:hypothetical protein
MAAFRGQEIVAVVVVRQLAAPNTPFVLATPLALLHMVPEPGSASDRQLRRLGPHENLFGVTRCRAHDCSSL